MPRSGGYSNDVTDDNQARLSTPAAYSKSLTGPTLTTLHFPTLHAIGNGKIHTTLVKLNLPNENALVNIDVPLHNVLGKKV